MQPFLLGWFQRVSYLQKGQEKEWETGGCDPEVPTGGSGAERRQSGGSNGRAYRYLGGLDSFGITGTCCPTLPPSHT